MASTLTAGTEVNDLPRLSLTLDFPPSSSPFPSPSSSFVPPPMPIPHEFALRPPPQQGQGQSQQQQHATDAKSQSTNQTQNVPDNADAAPETAVDKHDKTDNALDTPMPTPLPPLTPTIPDNEAQSSFVDENTPLTASDPRTPTPAAHALPATPDESSSRPPSNRSSLSLTSSRPAPPSPSPRRLSKASARSSTSSLVPSIPLSRVSSMSKRSQATSRLSITSTLAEPEPLPEPPEAQQQQQQPQKFVPSLIKIRDFAFASEDERHEGLGSDVPKANRPRRINRWHYRALHQRDSVSSSDGDGEDDTDDGESWGGMTWSFGGGRFGWGTGIAGGQSSRMDFARNFVTDGEEHFYDVDDDDEDDGDFGGQDAKGEGAAEGGAEGDDEEEGVELDLPLYPGLYRALYAFEPEGTAEMGLEEDQIVRVIGRGGGVGWAVVLRENPAPDEQTHALVPESYLEPFKLEREGR